MYYSLNKINGYNRLWSMIVGSRSIGKSYAVKRHVMSQWLKKRERWIYMRRYSTEIDQTKLKKFFDDVRKEFPSHTWEYKQKCFYCDGELCGEVISLSKSASFASAVFNGESEGETYHYGTIIFDEFIIRGNVYHYMKKEVHMLLDLYVTIAREYRTRVFMLGNQRDSSGEFDSYSNPYFEFWDIEPRESGIVTGKRWVCEFVNMDSVEHINKEFLELVEGTSYAEQAIHNKVHTNFDHIAERKGKFYCKLAGANEGAINIYTDDGKYYCECTKNENGAMSNDIALQEGFERVSDAIKTMLLDSYRKGYVFFADHSAKNKFYNIIIKGRRNGLF